MSFLPAGIVHNVAILEFRFNFRRIRAGIGADVSALKT